ncbi:hypothetical protein [Azohydromonas lata]|uniref:Uncharacterized protein n=1 Tax=Azohydromonas lata TaxID=45677 RepID=A0ABU5I8B6_9BURK|nr:hypothetical protein [Azohydromonas lata]MDZ5455329.1 hypothetical protein [Azohydromonas lata]
MTTNDTDCSSARGLNRVDPIQLNQVLVAIAYAGQCPYAAGSLLPPNPKPEARWPMLGAPLSARIWQLAEWLNSDTHTGRGSLPAPVRREVSRFLSDQGLAHISPQDLVRGLASLARLPGGADEPVPQDRQKVMLRAMKNDRRFASWPSASVGATSRDNQVGLRRLIKTAGMPGLWARYALRVVMHAMGLALDDRASLWLLRHALRRAALDVSLSAHPHQAPAASMLRRAWQTMLDDLVPAAGRVPSASEWENVKRRWTQQEPLFNPLRHGDIADPALIREWIINEARDAQTRGDLALKQQLDAWPVQLPEQVHAWAWAVARELMDATRYGDFRLHEAVRLEPALPEGDRPEQDPPTSLHYLAVQFKQKRRKSSRLHHVPDAILHEARRATLHSHFRYMADHPPLAHLATLEIGRDLACDH